MLGVNRQGTGPQGDSQSPQGVLVERVGVSGQLPSKRSGFLQGCWFGLEYVLPGALLPFFLWVPGALVPGLCYGLPRPVPFPGTPPRAGPRLHSWLDQRLGESEEPVNSSQLMHSPVGSPGRLAVTHVLGGGGFFHMVYVG